MQPLQHEMHKHTDAELEGEETGGGEKKKNRLNWPFNEKFSFKYSLNNGKMLKNQYI